MFGLRRSGSRPPVPAPVDRLGSVGTTGGTPASGYPRYAGTLGTAHGSGRALEESGLPSFFSPTPVTDSTALALPAAWRCLNVIANGIGILDIYASDTRDENPTRLSPTPNVLADPWPLISPMNWKVSIVTSMVLHGDAYCLMTDYDAASGYPRQLPIISPHDVSGEVIDGMPIYWINGEGPYGPLDIMHFRGLCLPGELFGIGVIEAHRRGIGYALDLDRYGSATFTEGAVPPIILHVNRPELSREQALDIQERWMMAHGFGQRTPAVLPASITAETVAFSPQDAEFLQSRIQSAVEICWMFGVDPRVLAIQGGQGSLTYANLEMAQAELARDSFMPWTTRVEQMLSRALPRHIDARFNFAAMMRPTLIDRYTAYEVALRSGFLTVDEVRRNEDLPPLEGEDVAPAVPIRTSVTPEQEAING